MTKTNKTPQLFEVCRIAFRYEDNPTVVKERPVIIADIDRASSSALVMAIKVTSHAIRPGVPGEVQLQDWLAEGLTKPSVARCTKRAILQLSDFQNNYCYGRLSERDKAAVLRALREIGAMHG